MKIILAPIWLLCVSGKFVYQSAEDVLNKSAERLVCQDCNAQMGQGIPHPCTMLERQKNLTAIVKSTSPTAQGKVLSSSIKDLSTNNSGKP